MSEVDFSQYDSEFIDDLPLNEASIVVLREALRAFGLIGFHKVQGRGRTEIRTREALASFRLFLALSTDIGSVYLADALKAFNDISPKTDRLSSGTPSHRVDYRSWYCLTLTLRQLAHWVVSKGPLSSVDSEGTLQGAIDSMYDLSQNKPFGVHLRYGRDDTVIWVPPVDRFLSTPLWANEDALPNEPKEWLLHNQPQNLALMKNLSRDRLTWGFWENWYQSLLDGVPLDQELQSAVARISNDIWEAGAEAVADAIREIEAKRAGDLPRPDNVPELVRSKLLKYVERLLAAPEMTALAADGAAATLQRAISEYLVKAEVNCLPDELSHLEGMPALFQGISKIVKSGEKAGAKARHLADQIEALNAKVAKLEAALKAARAKTVHGLFKQSAIKAAGAAFGGGVVGTLGVGLAHFFGGWPDDFTLENLRGFLSDLETAKPNTEAVESLPPSVDT